MYLKELEEENNIEYRQIMRDNLKRKFGIYSFITEKDIDDELKKADVNIYFNSLINSLNTALSNELIKAKPDNLRILKLLKDNNLGYLNNIDIYIPELNILNEIKDICQRTNKKFSNDYYLEYVYRLSELSQNYSSSPLLNYMCCDMALYAKVANQIRLDEKNNIIDTFLVAATNPNLPLYQLTKTATIKYFKQETNDSLVEDMLLEVLKSYHGDSLMPDHIAMIVKREYEKKHGLYVYDPNEKIYDYEEEDTIQNNNVNIMEHEYYGHHSKIWDIIKTPDKDYHDFLVLKYKELLSLDEIIKIMSISEKQIIEYYVLSLKYIKDNVNQININDNQLKQKAK